MPSWGLLTCSLSANPSNLFQYSSILEEKDLWSMGYKRAGIRHWYLQCQFHCVFI